MKANEFIRNTSINRAKEELKHRGTILAITSDQTWFDELKRLVESHELVESFGGLNKAKNRCYPAKHLTMDSFYELKQAIADVESCQ